MYATDLDARDDAIGCVGMGIEASDVCLVAMPRCEPFLT